MSYLPPLECCLYFNHRVKSIHKMFAGHPIRASTGDEISANLRLIMRELVYRGARPVLRDIDFKVRVPSYHHAAIGYSPRFETEEAREAWTEMLQSMEIIESFKIILYRAAMGPDGDEVISDEDCPGCGCGPGDGITDDCFHPIGCGWFKNQMAQIG